MGAVQELRKLKACYDNLLDRYIEAVETLEAIAQSEMDARVIAKNSLKKIRNMLTD